jgi:hypothetical protein
MIQAVRIQSEKGNVSGGKVFEKQIDIIKVL